MTPQKAGWRIQLSSGRIVPGGRGPGAWKKTLPMFAGTGPAAECRRCPGPRRWHLLVNHAGAEDHAVPRGHLVAAGGPDDPVRDEVRRGVVRGPVGADVFGGFPERSFQGAVRVVCWRPRPVEPSGLRMLAVTIAENGIDAGFTGRPVTFRPSSSSTV
ncbi:hypothetical protein [Streptomyces sp. NPDC002394]